MKNVKFTQIFVAMLAVVALFLVPAKAAQASIFSSRITVRNLSGATVYVKVSKACGTGQDGYWRIPHGQTESWSRCVLATVKLTASRSHSDTARISWVNHSVKFSTGCNYFVFTELQLITYAGPDITRCK